MRKLRQLVRQCVDSDARLRLLDEQHDGRVSSSIHIPNIVHSSFARFIDEPEDSDLLAREFSQLAESFEPFSITVTTLTLANEVLPYMHQPQELGALHCYPLGL